MDRFCEVTEEYIDQNLTTFAYLLGANNGKGSLVVMSLAFPEQNRTNVLVSVVVVDCA